MGNTKDKKDVELKRIPRNPNMPIKDEEVEKLLKQAAEQISQQEKKAGKKEQATKKSEEAKNSTDAMKKIPENKKIPEFKKREDSKKKDSKEQEESKIVEELRSENSNRNNSANKKSNNKKTKSEKKSGNKSVQDKKKDKNKNKEEKEFKVEDDIYVTKKPTVSKKDMERNYKMTVGEVIGAIFEGIWTGIKLLVLLAIITVVVGFFMSRDLLIRGRSGEQISKQGMNVAATALSTRLEERESGKSWNEAVDKQKLTLTADDGKILVAQKVVVDKNNNNWVVILHGQNGTVEDIYDIGFHYAKEGYNILMPDLRAHGESEGSFFGMGWLDRLDVINWIDVIVEEYPSADVVIHGVDLGADTALMLSGEPLKDSVKAIVAEGAYTNAWEAVKTEYETRHEEWPVFPILNMVNPVAKVWGGYTLKEADAVKQVQNAKVPILLIHGKNDTYVTEAMTEELNQAIASEHEVLTIETGTHEDCRFAEPDTYYNKVMEFIEKYVK